MTDTESQLDEALTLERAVLERFDHARQGGASDRTALSLAAWVWMERYGGSTLIAAKQEVRRLLSRYGRHVTL